MELIPIMYTLMRATGFLPILSETQPQKKLVMSIVKGNTEANRPEYFPKQEKVSKQPIRGCFRLTDGFVIVPGYSVEFDHEYKHRKEHHHL